MSRLTPSVCVCLVFVVAMTIGGCGSGSGVKLAFPGGTAMAIDQGQSVTIKATATGDAGMGVTWTCSGAACTTLGSSSTTSVTFNATGTSGTATITATSIKQTTVTGTVTVTVTAPPAISTTQAQVTAAPVTAGVPYSFSFAATGGAGTLTWSATGLPAGLSISSSTGAISGTATAKGTGNITVTVMDSSAAGPKSTSSNLTLTINNPAPPAISTTQVQVTAAPATVGSAYAFTFHATGTGTLTWSATGLPSNGLSLAASTGIVSGTPTSNAPVSFTLTVSDSFGQSSATTAFVVTVNIAPLAISTNSLPSGTVNTSYTATITASGGVPPYTFSLDATSTALPATLTLATGSPSATISGTPASTGTTSNIVVDVTDSEGTPMTAQKTYSITINAANVACGSGSESLLDGQYAILLRGFDTGGPATIGATFDADGAGHIAKLVGIEDINTTTGIGPQLNLSITSASSSYSVGSDHRGCLTISTSAGTQTFRFSLNEITAGVASNGHIIEFDSTGSNTSGVLRQQTTADFSTAQISGNFAFGVSGSHVGGGKFAAVGLFSFNGAGGFNGSPASVVDFNDKGSVDGNGSTYPTNPVSLGQPSYSISANGRGIFSFLPGGGGNSAVNTILYVVSSSELLVFSSDPQSADNAFAGSAVKQTAASFSASSLSAKSILYTTGLGSNGGTPVSRVNGAILTITSVGNFSFSGQQNDGGNISPQSATGTYSVGSDGRVTLAGGGGGGAPIIYLVGANKGFVLFTDGSGTPHVESGFLEPQTGTSLSTSSATTLAFGTIQPDDSSVSDNAGVVTFNAGNVTGTNDKNSDGTLNAGGSISDTSSIDATGLGSIPANCTLGTNCGNFFFVISPTKIVLLGADPSSTDPNLQVAEQ